MYSILLVESGFANSNALIYNSLHMIAKAQHPGLLCCWLSRRVFVLSCFSVILLLFVFLCVVLLRIVGPTLLGSQIISSLWCLLLGCVFLDRISDCLNVGPYNPAIVPGNKLSNCPDCQVVISQVCGSKQDCLVSSQSVSKFSQYLAEKKRKNCRQSAVIRCLLVTDDSLLGFVLQFCEFCQ